MGIYKFEGNKPSIGEVSDAMKKTWKKELLINWIIDSLQTRIKRNQVLG